VSAPADNPRLSSASAVALRAPERRSLLRLSKDAIWMTVLFIGAFLMRLVPVLDGSGVLGIGHYDDGVHYAAALALVNGQMPYRDFLFLQPPGIVIALIPFAALGAATHDSLGFIVARLAWMLLGGVNAVLVARLLRRTGTLAAVAGGVFYAVYYPAIHIERSILLEGLTNACLVVALLLAVPSERRLDRPWRFVVAGALLGISTGIKIWGLVIALVVIIRAVVARRPRDAGLVAIGTVAGATAVCGPFFVAAPGAMWRMVVRDQVMRPARGGDVLHRLPAIAAVPGTALQSAMVICLVFAWLTPGLDASRRDNPDFQDFALRYLSSGSASLVVRFRNGTRLPKQTFRDIRSWPQLSAADGYEVRRPAPVSAR
jgi:hypothetical protein